MTGATKIMNFHKKNAQFNLKAAMENVRTVQQSVTKYKAVFKCITLIQT